MLIDSKNGETTMLTTSRHALQKLSPSGVFIGFKNFVFNVKLFVIAALCQGKDRLLAHIGELPYICVVLLLTKL